MGLGFRSLGFRVVGLGFRFRVVGLGLGGCRVPITGNSHL